MEPFIPKSLPVTPTLQHTAPQFCHDLVQDSAQPAQCSYGPACVCASVQANASEAQGKLLPRQLQRRAYSAALIKRFRHLPDIRRIERHRHLPAALYKVGVHYCAAAHGAATSAPARPQPDMLSRQHLHCMGKTLVQTLHGGAQLSPSYYIVPGMIQLAI